MKNTSVLYFLSGYLLATVGYIKPEFVAIGVTSLIIMGVALIVAISVDHSK